MIIKMFVVVQIVHALVTVRNVQTFLRRSYDCEDFHVIFLHETVPFFRVVKDT